MCLQKNCSILFEDDAVIDRIASIYTESQLSFVIGVIKPDLLTDNLDCASDAAILDGLVLLWLP